ncbi:helix-turn-helix domain-containing protein [Amphibacillus cookii]|uniref:helix-turn-helix domain-containing protein n=1 Tax=Amphibacillus cookii TaxID=767787 RepID=UPI001959BFDC|nr:RodZ domain-containing protein [Amphibacillus cookii]MBM7540635.1 cytoskeletal protein RodZ [Amphibacillus cookii]
MQIGEKLKEARLDKGLSLDDVQRLTKIQTRHLQAIERNDFSVIPGSFYTRAFIKEYANVVDLDPNQLLDEHRNEIPASETENAVEYTRMQRTRGKTTSSKTSPFASLLPTVFVILLIVGVGFFIWRITLGPGQQDAEDGNEQVQTDQSAGDEVSLPPDTSDEDNGQEQPDSNDNDDEGEEEEEQEEDSEDPELTFFSYESNQSIYQLETDDETIELTIETSDSNWLEIEDDSGERLYYSTFQSSESPLTIDVTDESFVYLRFGNPSVIDLSINDLEVVLSEDIAPTAVQQVWIYINEEPES